MDSQEMTMTGGEQQKPERVVEFELHMPKREELSLPKVNTEAVRDVAEKVLLTGLGLTVLATRAVSRTLDAANKAGKEAADNPGPVTRALLGVVREEKEPGQAAPSRKVPILPIADYDSLETVKVIARLPSLNREQLMVLRDYELSHGRRTAIIKAIDGQLTTAS